MNENTWIIDCAGGKIGGAARFQRELDAYITEHPEAPVRLFGKSRYLTPRWMSEREFIARGYRRRIAMNNVSFMGGEHRTVLVRNALHFASREEMSAVNHIPTRTFQVQTAVVRATVNRATRIVVPCSAMAERVLRYVPGVESRVHVQFHPVTVEHRPERPVPGRILVPIVPSPYKNLDQHARLLLEALDLSGTEANLVFTASAHDLPTAHRDPRVHLIGVQDSADLEIEWARAAAIYFPTALESFGYPLAEARVLGRRIIALNTPQNQEIAGRALAGYEPNDIASLCDALIEALTFAVEPDPAPFDRDSRIEWLLDR